MMKFSSVLLTAFLFVFNLQGQSLVARSGKTFDIPVSRPSTEKLSAGTIFFEGFQNGIPSSFKLFNVDGLTPAPIVGFVNNAWVAREDYIYNPPDSVIFSTSWYIPPGQADDWIITPAINIGSSCVLSWEAVAPDPFYPDGYEVRISTTTQTVSGCLANPPLFSTAAEDSVWTFRSVDLADSGYANQTVYIAFRNNTYDSYLLLIDDIKLENTGNMLVDGSLSEPEYMSLASKQNNNSGFGTSIDASQIVYYPDLVNQKIYLGIKGKLSVLTSDGIGLWLNVSDVLGMPAGNPLGGNPGSHYMGNTGNNNFISDFQVDYMFALNPGSGTTAVYLDAVGLEGTRTAQYIGSCSQAGTAASGPSSSGLFSQNSFQFAFNNSGTADKGFEVCIPFSELGITSAGTIQAFAFVVSATAYFSNVTVPGNISGSNPGFNPDFTLIAGGPYHSGVLPVPVELVSFNAVPAGDAVYLSWTTASEVNNKGFTVERKTSGNWEEIGFVPGKATTTGINNYSFTDTKASVMNNYRLKQADFDGKVTYSREIEVNLSSHGFVLEQNYPNPFNPETYIQYSIPEDGFVSLKVYDVTGREVLTLINESRKAGTYSCKIDAKSLSSGIYYYRLSSGNYNTARKMIVLK